MSLASFRPSPGADVFSAEELQRYSRHFVLPEVGRSGQEKLKAASVLVVGAGGLGSPALLYLAAAGVGTIGIADMDSVDASNLQRQVVHTSDRIGRPKTASAAETLRGINPNVVVKSHNERLTSDNALEILRPYDVVIDGTDNFPTRYLLNDACVLLGKPCMYGSVLRFEGQASVFDARRGPCYRCLFPEPPPPELAPNCAEAGVLGVLPGIIGSIQANEAIKIILGVGDVLIGRLLLFDALRMEFREVTLRKDPGCPVCGKQPMITTLIDYEAFCGSTTTRKDEHMIKEITVEELKRKMDEKANIVLLDVRQQEEHEYVNIGGALIPLNELQGRLGELDKNAETVVYCRRGRRSARAVAFMQQQGFSNVENLRGGILAWAEKIDPSKPRY